MGVFYETIPKTLSPWILQQKVFWVATAPLSSSGHVNVSPKGGQYFGLIDDKTFWYMDLTGSGNETLSHLWEPHNGRITIMFNAFEGGPKIVRLWGHGRVLENGTDAFSDFVSQHELEVLPHSRSIIMVDIHQVGSSCGFSVPFMDFKEFRPTLNNHFEKLDAKHKSSGKVEDSMDHYWAYKNSWSIDGLPGMARGQAARKKHKVEPLKKMVGPMAPTRYQTRYGVPVGHVLLIALVAFLLGLMGAYYAPAITKYIREGRRPIPAGAISFRNIINVTHVPPAWEGLTALWSTK